jgi:hypothetical protein
MIQTVVLECIKFESMYLFVSYEVVLIFKQDVLKTLNYYFILLSFDTTGWTIGIWGSISGGWEFFSSPPRPEWLWSSPSLLSSGYQGLFP